jgi:uncharacterized membrane protein
MDSRPADIDRYERAGSAAIGAVMAAAGLATHRARGSASAALGALLIARGITGRCPVSRWQKERGVGEVRVRRSVTILRPPGEIYGLFRHFELLPEFMLHVVSVTPRRDGTWHWVVKEGPMQLAWDAMIVDDEPAERLEWRSLPGGDVEHVGVLELASEPAGRGTEVRLAMSYRPPGGIVTAPFRSLFARTTDTLFATELRRMKQLVEAGEIATNARCGERAGAALVAYGSTDRLDHPVIAGVIA